MPPKGWKKESPTKLTCVITWVATPKIIALQVELEKRKKCPDKGFFWREALHWFFNSETEEELKEIPRRPIGTKIVPVTFNVSEEMRAEILDWSKGYSVPITALMEYVVEKFSRKMLGLPIV